MRPHGYFHWNELNTHDVPAARRFYGETLGWTFEEMPMGEGVTYTVCTMKGEPVGGIFDLGQMEGMENVPDHWASYLSVDDVDARVASARQAGATILREPWDVDEVGRIAILKDPSGAMMGWITPVAQ
jgi:uncharacterized protein